MQEREKSKEATKQMVEKLKFPFCPWPCAEGTNLGFSHRFPSASLPQHRRQTPFVSQNKIFFLNVLFLVPRSTQLLLIVWSMWGEQHILKS